MFHSYLKLHNNQPLYVGEGSRERALCPKHNKTLHIEEHVCSLILSSHHDKVAARLQEQGLILWLQASGTLLNRVSCFAAIPASTLPFWTDGEQEVRAPECPGPAWKRGRISRPNSAETRAKLSERGKGRKWWNNGVEQTLAYTSPGPEWKEGKFALPPGTREKMRKAATGRSWWNNGETTTLSHTCPGPGWRKGRSTK